MLISDELYEAVIFILINFDSKILADMDAHGAWAGSGDYSKTCEDCSIDPQTNVLSCRCYYNAEGKSWPNRTSIDLNKCYRDLSNTSHYVIINSGGVLKCRR